MPRTHIAQLQEAVHIAWTLLRDAEGWGASRDRIATLRDRVNNALANLAEAQRANDPE